LHYRPIQTSEDFAGALTSARTLAIKPWKGIVQAKKACKIVLAPLTAGRGAVPKPLNWLFFPSALTTQPRAVEKLLHIFNFLVPLRCPHRQRSPQF